MALFAYNTVLLNLTLLAARSRLGRTNVVGDIALAMLVLLIGVLVERKLAGSSGTGASQGTAAMAGAIVAGLLMVALHRDIGLIVVRESTAALRQATGHARTG